MIGYNVLELFGCYWQSYCLIEPIGYASTNYSNLPDKIKALQILILPFLLCLILAHLITLQHKVRYQMRQHKTQKQL